MNSECSKSESKQRDSLILIAEKLIWIFWKRAERLLFSKKADEESNGHVIKKQLRCAISSCFDKNDICCKVCDIKKCRYKCNFIDTELCEHQKVD